MAADWIKIEHALPNKPEVMLLSEILDISPMEVVGNLVCFWTWVDQNLSDSCPVVSGTFSGLDRVAGRAGFAQAMIDVGWLTVEDGNVRIPNYEDHLSESAKARGVEAKKKRIQRRKSGQMSPSVRDKKRTEGGLEKRREEKSIKERAVKTTRFVKPTVQEVTAYCQERKNVIDPQQFIDHNEANGWIRGRNTPMKDWKAAVRYWERSGVKRGKQQRELNLDSTDQWLKDKEAESHAHDAQ